MTSMEEALKLARDFIEDSSFSDLGKERFDATLKAIDAAMAVRSSAGSARDLIARADKYLNTGSGEYASDILRDMAEFIFRNHNIALRVEERNDPDEMSLIERLKNPAWCHADTPFESPQLAKEQTINDMFEAATEIERLQAAKRRALALADERAKEANGMRQALEAARRYCDQEMGPSRASLLYKIANVIDAALEANHMRIQPQAASRQIGFMEAMNMVERGFDTWKDKPHNAKWYNRIDGTPIPNDLKVNIAEAIVHYMASHCQAESVSPQMVDAALNAWFKSPPSETDQGLERSMKAALTAALALSRPACGATGKIEGEQS